MKILLIHQFFILENEPGGSRHINLLRSFRKQGHEVSVLAGSVNYMTNHSRLPAGRLFKRQTVEDIRITWIYAFPFLSLGLPGKFLTFLSFFVFSLPWVLLEKPDVILATSPPPTVPFLGWILGKARRIPWIFEIRDLWPDTARDLEILPHGILERWAGKTARFLYRQSSHLVPLTWGIEKELLEIGIPGNQVTTIPNGVDEIFKNPGDFGFPELKILQTQGKFLVFYVGAMGRANGLDTLLKTAEFLSDKGNIQFVLAGDGPLRKDLEKTAAQKSLSNVTFLGSVPRDHIPSLLQYADAGIVTLAKGSFSRQAVPNKLFDYLASAVPVLLALEPGDASEILEKAGGGVRVASENFEAMRRQLLYWAENPAEAKKMGAQGKEYVMRHFLRENLAKQYLEIIESVKGKAD